ncbi:alpha/beta hydrolase [Intrasporangium sp.]|uniref:alpha/beta hydrolase n=1 Tax=Intrasporangium sp. TaxID=1925024 RepID=UPI00293B3CB6|nr:alpha/beta hydrolase [Intrasporangium sp.]MDV3220226.1 alpha/beta hydrolase [Intrasporangium sp.]
MTSSDLSFEGHAGTIVGRRWTADTATPPEYVVLIVHGYGEHSGRYGHVAARLVEDGAVVYAIDHVGHGRSDGERVLINSFQEVEEDVHLLEARAREEHPTLPVVLIGHSMGGLIGARYAQRWGDGLAAIVLSGPVLGRWRAAEALLAADEIPDAPIDPSTLSRDPAVGEAYVADPLVWHGPFKRPTLEAIEEALAMITGGGAVDDPILWLHGEEDELVPMADTKQGWATLAGRHASSTSYPGARHEIFNETNHDEVLDDVIAFIRAHVHRPDDDADFVVPARFCGPPESGNGGWVSGHLAARHAASTQGGGVSVRLMSPPPLDRPMRVDSAGDELHLVDGDVLVARASAWSGSRPSGIRPPVSYVDALAAAEHFQGVHEHPFPTCFSCGTTRDPDDGLCLRPGPVPGTDVHAAAWVPRESTPEIVWAALDCPGAWALGVGGRPMVLGTMTAWVDRLPEIGAEHVVVAWVIGGEGRKHRTGTALYAGDELVAQAEATWIAVDPETIRPA